MTQNDINSKYLEFLNEAYASENAAVERITSRIEETPIPELRQRLEQHFQETIGQQIRLSDIIFRLGGEPTDSKAHLPELKAPITSTLKKRIEDTVKSVPDNNKNNILSADLELLKIKQDIVIEDSEIVIYKTLIEISQRMPDLDVNLIVPFLKHSLDEELNMQKWCMDNLPKAIDILLPKILSIVDK